MKVAPASRRLWRGTRALAPNQHPEKSNDFTTSTSNRIPDRVL